MYLDPGFGSMLIQVVVALIAACGAYFIIAKDKIGLFFKKKSNKKILKKTFRRRKIKDERI